MLYTLNNLYLCVKYHSFGKYLVPWCTIHLTTPLIEFYVIHILACVGHLEKWNIIKFTNKATSIGELNGIHKVVLDGISENTALFVK